MAEKEGSDHFMLKEIFEQPQVIKKALERPESDIKALSKMIISSDNVLIAATGTSMNAALVGEY